MRMVENRRYPLLALLTLAALVVAFVAFRYFPRADHAALAASAAGITEPSTISPTPSVAPTENANPRNERAGVANASEPRDPAAPSFLASPGKLYAVTRLAKEYARLAADATNGDLIAARTLYKGLITCERAPQDAKAMDDLRRKVKDPNYKYAKSPDGGEHFLAYQTSLLSLNLQVQHPGWDRVLRWKNSISI